MADHDDGGAGGSAAGPRVELELPNAARVYDYYLGGAANFALDRELGDELLEAEPRVVEMSRSNRSFLGRAVNYCTQQGIRQFLDLGSGMPTVGNVHEVAQRIEPQCRVAYVDVEPVVVAHSKQVLVNNPTATVTQADMRDPEAVLSTPGVAGLLDFTRPVALLAVMMLQYFPDTEELIDILTCYRERLRAGGYLVLTHMTSNAARINMSEIAGRTRRANHAHPRSADEVARLFTGTELVPPGLVWVEDWRPASGIAEVPEQDRVGCTPEWPPSVEPRAYFERPRFSRIRTEIRTGLPVKPNRSRSFRSTNLR